MRRTERLMRDVEKYTRESADSNVDALWWLLDWEPGSDIKKELKDRRFEAQPIEWGWGAVNVDYYLVRITRLPCIDGALVTPEDLLHRVRVDLDDFVDTRYASFTPTEPIDASRWNARDALGAVVNIDCKLIGPLRDRAGVVVSQSHSNSWVFTTVRGPRLAGPGTHPVSGNREFGFYPSGNDFMFYTRGIDRVTTVSRFFLAFLVFAMTERLWQSFQRKLYAFVNANNGQAEIVVPHSERYVGPKPVR